MRRIPKMIFCGIMGYVYVPDSVKNTSERKLLHISDTPYNFFGALKRLLKELSPNIIIHTGDMVDNVKLGLYKHQLHRYDYYVKSIIKILEDSDAEEIYICAGNHDSIDTMRKYVQRSIIIEDSLDIEVFNVKASISHYPDRIIKNPANYNFFGHDTSLGNDFVNGKFYLNGVLTINVITADTKKLFYLSYPSGTDDARLMRGKIGL